MKVYKTDRAIIDENTGKSSSVNKEWNDFVYQTNLYQHLPRAIKELSAVESFSADAALASGLVNS